MTQHGHAEMPSTNRRKLVVALLSLVIVASAASAFFLAILPALLDEFLLTNDDRCLSTIEDDGADLPAAGRYVDIDYGDYEGKIVSDGSAEHSARQALKHPSGGILHSVLWRLSLHLWRESSKKGNSMASTACPVPKMQHRSSDESPWGTLPGMNDSRSTRLHPMCRDYRNLRARLRFERLLVPWNWYYRNRLQVRGLTLHSLAEGVSFVSRGDSSLLSWRGDDARVRVVSRSEKNPAEPSARTGADDAWHSISHLPPTIAIDSVDIIQSSWIRPVISTHLRGVTINAVLQKGGFPLTKESNAREPGEVANSALLIGAMPIHELISILPRPPEVRGLYPRIGLLNVTNVTLCVYENKGIGDVQLLLRMKIPGEVFHPITNLTLSHKETGIDRKDLQPMLEASLSNALRRHLLREAAAAFRNGWVHAMDQWSHAQHFIERTQELYFDRWVESGMRAWHQAQDNVWRGVADGTQPLRGAVEDWAAELREIFSEPGHHLSVIVSHHWNRTVEGMHKHGIAVFDNQVWRHIHDMVSRPDGFKYDTKHRFDEIREAFEKFMAKSGREFESLAKSCESEVKEMWLEWHRQFLPEL